MSRMASDTKGSAAEFGINGSPLKELHLVSQALARTMEKVRREAHAVLLMVNGFFSYFLLCFILFSLTGALLWLTKGK